MTQDPPSGDSVWSHTVGPAAQAATWSMPAGENLRRSAGERAPMREALARAPFPLYGLPAPWAGGRFLGGSHRSWPDGTDRHRDPGVLHAASLVHGTNVEGEGPMLVVETATEGAGAGGGPMRVAAERIWAGRDPGEREGSADVEREILRSVARLTIDGRPVDLDVVSAAAGARWVGRAQIGDYTLILEGHDFPLDGLALVRICDLSPYQSP